jgi:hypothetical protein
MSRGGFTQSTDAWVLVIVTKCPASPRTVELRIKGQKDSSRSQDPHGDQTPKITGTEKTLAKVKGTHKHNSPFLVHYTNTWFTNFIDRSEALHEQKVQNDKTDISKHRGQSTEHKGSHARLWAPNWPW